jgi:hypothetical protein
MYECCSSMNIRLSLRLIIPILPKILRPVLAPITLVQYAIERLFVVCTRRRDLRMSDTHSLDLTCLSIQLVTYLLPSTSGGGVFKRLGATIPTGYVQTTRCNPQPRNEW